MQIFLFKKTKLKMEVTSLLTFEVLFFVVVVVVFHFFSHTGARTHAYTGRLSFFVDEMFYHFSYTTLSENAEFSTKKFAMSRVYLH